MAHSVFEVDTFIEASPEEVYNFLSKLDEHMQIHPLIINIQLVKTTARPDGVKVDHYLIRDRMKLGPFTTKFTYRVEMSSNPQGEIISDAYQSPNIHLHNTTLCLAEGNGTRVRERVEISAPGLLIQTVHKEGQAAHQQMFASLKQLLESRRIRA